jgi:amino acid transporter
MSQLAIPLPITPQRPARPAVESYGLKSQVLSPLETIGQSVANIAPTGTPTVVIPLVFAAAGSGTWFAYAFALVGILLVSLNIRVFAQRSASPGSLYTYAATGLGPAWGSAVGWALFIAYVACASSVTTGFANYVNVFVKNAFGLGQNLSTVALVLIIASSVVGSWYVAYKDVRLSTRLMLTLELISVTFILLVVGASLVHNGFRLDANQLALKDVTPSTLRLGLIFAIFSFTGFESAASLGSEARNPLRTIPRAVWQSALFVGLLFIVSSYAEVLGFAGHSVTLDKSDAPLQVLATSAGVPFLGVLITVGAIISFFACVLASITAGARVLFLMSRHGLLHQAIGGSHEANKTPHVAVTVSSIAALLPAVLLAARGFGMFDIYGLIGTTATLGFIVTYIAVSIAAPVYLHRRGELRWHHVLASLVSVAFMIVALVGAVYPLPPAPASYPVYAFALLLAVGVAWGTTRTLGSAKLRADLQKDLDAIETRFEDGAGI